MNEITILGKYNGKTIHHTIEFKETEEAEEAIRNLLKETAKSTSTTAGVGNIEVIPEPDCEACQ